MPQVVKNTRLRYISSPSPEGLVAVLNNLPFKVELKSIVPQGKRWFCWFVIPDSIEHKDLEKAVEGLPVDITPIVLEDF